MFIQEIIIENLSIVNIRADMHVMESNGGLVNKRASILVLYCAVKRCKQIQSGAERSRFDKMCIGTIGFVFP